MTLDGLDVAAVPRDELPPLLGRVVQLEAQIRLRLMQPEPKISSPEARILTADEAVIIAAAPSKRWLLAATRGHRCRRDLSRKAARFDEQELRAWLVGRGRR